MEDRDAQIVQNILRKLDAGQLVLFLGAGANKGSINSQGADAPDATELARLIIDEFIPDNKDMPVSLSDVCDFVQLRFSRPQLERFVYDVLGDFKPSNVLGQVAKFRWKRIFTTNYDDLLETAYAEAPSPVQKLYPIYNLDY